MFNEPSYVALALMRDRFADGAEVNAWLDGVQTQRRAEIVAELDGVCVGFAALYVLGEHFDHCGVLSLGVRESARRRGVGGILLATALRTAQSFLGLSKVQLTVLTENGEAIRLYRKNGFQIEGLLRHYVRRPGGFADALAMSVLLEPSGG